MPGVLYIQKSNIQIAKPTPISSSNSKTRLGCVHLGGTYPNRVIDEDVDGEGERVERTEVVRSDRGAGEGADVVKTPHDRINLMVSGEG